MLFYIHTKAPTSNNLNKERKCIKESQIRVEVMVIFINQRGHALAQKVI